MTRQEIETMPPDRLTALLAERVMGWTLKSTNGVMGWPRDLFYWDKPDRLQRNWNPTTDRNDLAELLAAVPESHVLTVGNELYQQCQRLNDRAFLSIAWSAVNLPPLVICQSVAVAVLGGET